MKDWLHFPKAFCRSNASVRVGIRSYFAADLAGLPGDGPGIQYPGLVADENDLRKCSHACWALLQAVYVSVHMSSCILQHVSLTAQQILQPVCRIIVNTDLKCC